MNQMEAIRRRFADLVDDPREGFDLVEAALLIARTAFPDLAGSRYHDLLKQWADRFQKRIGAFSSAGDILTALNRIVFEQERFQGDRGNYYDPQNSFLNRVIDRRKGIPITLSLIYTEVGRRSGIPLQGIAMPGHFIAGLFLPSGTLYIDPFNGGEILTEKECLDMMTGRYGARATEATGWNRPAGKKTILKRMLRNLRAIYTHSDNEMQALEMIEWILALDPDARDELKARALLYEAMGNDASALRDFEHYLSLAPPLEDNSMIQKRMSRLRGSKGRLH